MGTYYKTAEETFNHRMSLQKSVESSIILIMLTKITWESGITFLDLKAEIERRKGRTFSKVRIYTAISLINRYGKNHRVYLRSGFGWVLKNGKSVREFRYFIPKELDDINREKIDLEHKKEIVTEKETHLDHHEKIIIPQEERLAEIQR